MRNIFQLDKNDYKQKNDFRSASQKKNCARGENDELKNSITVLESKK